MTLTERSAAVELPAARLDGTLAASPAGDIYMFTDQGAQRISDTAQLRIPLPDLPKPWRAFVNANGNIVLAWPDCTIARVIVDPASIEWFEPDVECLIADASLAIDGRDRVWASTSSALWVFPVAGAPIEYPVGTIPVTATGASAIAVVGRGPKLPPIGPRPTTTIRGHVNISDESGGNITRAVILRSLNKRADGSRDFEFRTLTDHNGDFEFTDVPVARYEVETEDGEYAWSHARNVQAMIDDGVIHLLEPY